MITYHVKLGVFLNQFWCHSISAVQLDGIPSTRDLDVSKYRGTPKWMVFIMENPIKLDDLGGVKTLIFGGATHFLPKVDHAAAFGPLPLPLPTGRRFNVTMPGVQPVTVESRAGIQSRGLGYEPSWSCTLAVGGMGVIFSLPSRSLT